MKNSRKAFSNLATIGSGASVGISRGLQLWTPPGGGSEILFIGAIEFRDVAIPKPGKDEWGVDTLERQMRGPACAYDDFYSNLAQGQAFTANGTTFHLQTWKPVADKIFPGATLLYKGLYGGTVPDQFVTGEEVELSGQISVSSPQKASRTLRYSSWKSVYKYITTSKPTQAANSSIDVNVKPQVTFSVITDQDGKIIYGNAPAALVTALTPAGYTDVATLDSSVPIIGTPYFECQDTVTRYFPIQ